MSLDTLHTAETPEGIALSLRPAGLLARCLAFAVDLAIRACIYITFAIVLASMRGMGTALLLVAYFLLEWFYPVVFELTQGGATPGKKMLGIEVVMASGLPVTPAASIIRNLLRAADFLPVAYGFGMLSMLWRSNFKRLGDIAAGTLVVYRETVALHGELPDALARAPVRTLAPREQAAIVAWAGRASRLTPARLDELAMLARSVTNDPARPPDALGQDNTQRLLGVAQWLLGRRSAGNP